MAILNVQARKRLCCLGGTNTIAALNERQAEARCNLEDGRADNRRLLIIGASAVVGQAVRRGAPQGSWLARMLTRKPRMLVSVALANKMARIAWALLAKGEDYKAPVAVAA
jgi:hypothetical protein